MNLRFLFLILTTLGLLYGCGDDGEVPETEGAQSSVSNEPDIGPPVISKLEYPKTELSYPEEEDKEE